MNNARDVGERRDGRRVAAVDDDGGSSGGGRGGGIILILCSGFVGGGRKDKNLSPTSFNSIPVYEITKAARNLLEAC